MPPTSLRPARRASAGGFGDDTSAILNALAGRPAQRALLSRLADDSDLHAPHLIDVEVLHALRRLARAGDLTEVRAEEVRDDFAELTLVRYPHAPLADRMWELRHNITAYDAAFVALAEALDVPLATADVRLARAGDHGTRIELLR